MDLLKKPTLKPAPPTRTSSKRAEARAPERGLQPASIRIHETSLVNSYSLSRTPTVDCRAVDRWKGVGAVLCCYLPARRAILSCLLLPLAISIRATGAESSAASPPQPAWGRITQSTNSTGTILLEVRSWPADGKLPLPTPFPNITAAHLISGSKRAPLGWIFNADATQLHLEVPTQPPAKLPATIELETAEHTAQFADGRIVFSALDTRVQGSHAKLESLPGNHRIGFWTDPADSASWEFKPTRWGMYDLEITFSADGGDGTELRFDIAGQTFIVARPSTGSWYRYQTLSVGRLYLAGAEPFTARASCKTLKGGAVMTSKAMKMW